MSEETTVRVPLTIEERAERADCMASLLAEIEAIDAEAKKDREQHKADRERVEGLLQAHGRVLREGEEERRQMDLTYPAEEAAKALHDVVAHADCTCEGGPEADVKSLACAVHGVDSRGPNPAPCDGNHTTPCDNPHCWLIEGPAEVGAVYEPPAETVIDVGTVEEPAAVSDFRAEKARRRARA